MYYSYLIFEVKNSLCKVHKEKRMYAVKRYDPNRRNTCVRGTILFQVGNLATRKHLEGSRRRQLATRRCSQQTKRTIGGTNGNAPAPIARSLWDGVTTSLNGR
ncbi:hypothetical protein Hanom_Chr09g00800661 [Helianthus anomalus]